MRFSIREKVTYEVVCEDSGEVMGKHSEKSEAAAQHQRLVDYYRCQTCRGSGNDPEYTKNLPPRPPDPPRSFIPEKFRGPACSDCNGTGSRAPTTVPERAGWIERMAELEDGADVTACGLFADQIKSLPDIDGTGQSTEDLSP